MAIRNPWHRLYSPKTIKRIPRRAGAYELGNKYQTVIYIGETSNLRRRMDEHVDDPKNDCIRKNARLFHYEIVRAHITRQRTLLKEYKDSHHGKIPPCNIQDPSRH